MGFLQANARRRRVGGAESEWVTQWGGEWTDGSRQMHSQGGSHHTTCLCLPPPPLRPHATARSSLTLSEVGGAPPRHLHLWRPQRVRQEPQPLLLQQLQSGKTLVAFGVVLSWNRTRSRNPRPHPHPHHPGRVLPRHLHLAPRWKGGLALKEALSAALGSRSHEGWRERQHFQR